MKKKGHPDYNDVLFIDTATGEKFVCGSTVATEETEQFEGKEYPVYRVPISSASHPFFTGSKQFLDTEGRVDKFKKRYAAKAAKVAEKAKEEKEVKKAKTPAKKKTAKTALKKKTTAKKEKS
jgi:large subunit ribosomal protein L31